MQIRRGTLAAWAAASNPVLEPGELGFVTDVGKTAFKIGNTAGTGWNTLPYVNSTYPELDVSAGNNLNTSLAQGRYPLLSGSSYTNAPGDFTSTTTDGSSILLVTVPTNNIIIQELTTSLTPCKRWIRAYNGTPAVWTAWKRIDTLSASESLSITNLVLSGSLTATGQITTLGAMGVGTASPQQRLDVNGNITSNRTAAGSFVVSGDGAYMFGTDAKQYIYGTPGNGGVVGIWASNAGGTSAQVLGVNSAGVTITGTITLPAGSVAGAAIANLGITDAQLAAGSVTSTKLSSIPRITTAQYYTGSGNFTVPAGVTSLRVIAVGGGGGGGSQNPGGFGGSGSSRTVLYSVTPAAVYAYTVGAGGAGAPSGGSNDPGVAGGNTTFLSVTAGGGGGASSATDGASGTSTLTTAPAGTTILADYLSSTASGGTRPRGSGFTAGVAYVVGGSYGPGSRGTGSTANGAGGANAASGGVGGMLIIEYIDLA